jgi:DNA-binding CsgD family transcriptional regulator/tetratricopeptide (TPR) repeat protein
VTQGIPSRRSTLCPLLIGRGPYIEILRQFCEQGRLGQGQTVILAGEAGIGKSRLAAEVKTMARQAGFTVLQSDCLEAECALPYAPFLRLLRRLAAETGSPDAPQLAELLPELRGAWPERETRARLEPDQARAEQCDALSSALTRQPPPLLLVIEDLHWCDEASLEFLLQFARSLVGRPILLLLTYRSDEAQPALRPLVAELERTQLAVELNLTRLPRADVAFMIRVIFEQARPVRAELAEALHALTNGNPLFVEEALQTLVAAGVVYQANGLWTNQPLAGLQLPLTVQAAVQRRQAQLSPGAQELLALAAVVGRPLDASLIRALAPADADQRQRQMGEVREAQLITIEPDGSFGPRHHLVRQAVYSGLMARERQALHGRVLAGLAAAGAAAHDAYLAEAAEHAFQAGQWAPAVLLARRAGERALALHWPRAASEHFTRALEAARRLDRPAPASLYHARGQAHEQLGEFEAARLDYEQEGAAARLARDPRGEWQSLVDLGFLWQARDTIQAGAYFQRAFTQAYTFNDPVVLNFSRPGRLPKGAIDTPCPRAAPPGNVSDQHALAATLDLLGAASYLSGDIVSGTDYFRQAIALFRELPDQMGLASSLMHIALGATLDTESSEVDLGEAVRYGEEALALTRSNGWRAEQAHVLSELAIGYGRQGEYTRAFDLADQGLALATELEHPALISYALAAKGSLYVDIYAAVEARPPLEQALSLAEHMPSLHLACFAGRYAALALLECGAQAAEINALLDRALRVGSAVAADGAGFQSLPERAILCARAQLALASGNAAAALELVSGLIEPAAPDEALGAPIATPRHAARPASVTLLLLRGEALSALREPAKAEAALRLAQRAAVEQGAVPSLWRIHAALGKHYLRFKQRALANTEFEQARAFIHGLAERIPEAALREEFLRQTRHLAPPAAPPPPRQAGRREFGGLTERERETVALIAEGKSNREIAAHLVVSDETVKTHVSHILSKLGLRSRTQIAAWAIQHGLTRQI